MSAETQTPTDDPQTSEGEETLRPTRIGARAGLPVDPRA